jgi:type IV secretory pathway VirB6-like protein
VALQKPIELSSGIILENSYHKITSINLDYVSKVFQLVVGIFANQQTRLSGKNFVLTNYFSNNDKDVFDEYFSIEVLNQTGQNPIERGYAFLKLLPDYESSVDV